MKIKFLVIVLCVANLLAGCSSKDPEAEQAIKELEKTNAERAKMENSGVPQEKVCSVFKKWAIGAEPPDYKTTDGKFYSCTTSRRAGNQGLIYSASGYNNKVNTAYISMSDLFKRGENVESLKFLVEQGNELAQAFASQPLSKDIETAITETKSGEWKLGDAVKVKLEKKEPQIDAFSMVLTFSSE